MAYQFSSEPTASFKVMTGTEGVDGGGTKLTMKGVNASLASADIICAGIDSLMSIASLSGDFSNANRTVVEDVIITD